MSTHGISGEQPFSAASAAVVNRQSTAVRISSGPFIIAAAALLIGVGVLLAVALKLDRNHMLYAVDDTFIHLSFARTLAESGTYGLYPGVYESATSSPAWSVVLAGFIYLLPRSITVLPFILNVVLALGVLWLLLRKQSFFGPAGGEYAKIAALLVLPYAIFLPGLIFIGMEHTLAAALLLVALTYIDQIAAGPVKPRAIALLLATLALAPLVRMETLALAVGCAAGLLASGHATAGGGRRRAVLSAAFIVCAATPLTAMGLINLRHGQAFLGNSATTKLVEGAYESGGVGAVRWLAEGGNFLANARQNPGVLVFTALLLLGTLAYTRSGHNKYRAAAIAMSTLAVAQFCVGQFGHFQRYESYLLCGCVFVLMRICGDAQDGLPLPHRAPIALLILLCVPFVQYKATLSIPRACNDHYLQQFQTGRFFAAYYNNQAVAVNDLGSSSFEHAGMVLDLDGLGSHEVANRMRMTGRPLGPEDMATFVEKAGVKVIAIYETWFPEGTPKSWTKVAELRMLRPRVVVAEASVSFFAPTPDLAATLAMNLTQFSASLPPNAALRFVRQ